MPSTAAKLLTLVATYVRKRRQEDRTTLRDSETAPPMVTTRAFYIQAKKQAALTPRVHLRISCQASSTTAAVCGSTNDKLTSCLNHRSHFVPRKNLQTPRSKIIEVARRLSSRGFTFRVGLLPVKHRNDKRQTKSSPTSHYSSCFELLH